MPKIQLFDLAIFDRKTLDVPSRAYKTLFCGRAFLLSSVVSDARSQSAVKVSLSSKAVLTALERLIGVI